MLRPIGNLWKFSAVSKINNFISRKAWITIRRSTVKVKVSNAVPVKWVLNNKKDPDGSISSNSRNT